jgi:hypothetical protein
MCSTITDLVLIARSYQSSGSFLDLLGACSDLTWLNTVFTPFQLLERLGHQARDEVIREELPKFLLIDS